jgi:D-amino peptidase
MKKLFISADIEGTCGIAAWDETHKDHPDYERYALRMSREVAAACEGALEGGMDLVMVRDAHGSARNLDWSCLPRQVQLIRGWGQDPVTTIWPVPGKTRCRTPCPPALCG